MSSIDYVTNTFRKLDDRWCIDSPHGVEGEVVPVTKKDGTVKYIRLGRRITDNKFEIDNNSPVNDFEEVLPSSSSSSSSEGTKITDYQTRKLEGIMSYLHDLNINPYPEDGIPRTFLHKIKIAFEKGMTSDEAKKFIDIMDIYGPEEREFEYRPPYNMYAFYRNSAIGCVKCYSRHIPPTRRESKHGCTLPAYEIQCCEFH